MKGKRGNTLDFSDMSVILTPKLRKYIRNRTLNITDIEIMTAIYRVGKHRGFFSTTERLAEALGITVRSVQSSLKKLKEFEFVEEDYGHNDRKCLWVVCKEITSPLKRKSPRK